MIEFVLVRPLILLILEMEVILSLLLLFKDESQLSIALERNKINAEVLIHVSI